MVRTGSEFMGARIGGRGPLGCRGGVLVFIVSSGGGLWESTDHCKLYCRILLGTFLVAKEWSYNFLVGHVT